ncbi:MAG: dihydroorotate dehydrogenase electron transfer subunit [Oligosphaeraceae bacterium]
MPSSAPLQVSALLLSQEHLQGAYWRMRLRSPEVCRLASPGQFVQLRLPALEGHILRRPFSICDVEDGETLTLVYKVVGAGTDSMTRLAPGASLDLLAPLGHGFSRPAPGRPLVLLGGGYGCAAMLFTARRRREEGADAPLVLLGARSQGDILLEREFRSLGCPVEISTDDGSLGLQGRITLLLETALRKAPDAFLQACGPMPMLKAVSQMAAQAPQAQCEVSLDERMCCGVGACFGCVVKARDASSPEGWRYLRSCKEGPVFPAEDLLW